jgi:hypothetical protein
MMAPSEPASVLRTFVLYGNIDRATQGRFRSFPVLTPLQARTNTQAPSLLIPLPIPWLHKARERDQEQRSKMKKRQKLKSDDAIVVVSSKQGNGTAEKLENGQNALRG